MEQCLLLCGDDTIVRLFASLTLWKRDETVASGNHQVLSLRQIFALPGAKEVMICFFCYCGLAATTGLWATSYMVAEKGLSPVQSASFAGLFYIGITIGRGGNGFLVMCFNDKQLIRMGQTVIAFGIVILFLLIHSASLTLIGLLLVGLGCIPIYLCIIHSTPHHFGKDRSQAVIGVQMASAYVGTTVLPPLFGLLGQHLNLGLFPFYLSIILIGMVVMHERLVPIHH